MDNEKNTELSQNVNNDELQEHMNNTFGIEFFVNELLPADLENQGYWRMALDQVKYVEPLLQLAPQLLVDKIYKGAVEKAFKAATENSYKCLLNPSMHLATIKGTTDVFIGTGLDNATNKVKGQARWLKNDAFLSISNTAQVVSNAFNALSTVTGQYFMAQVNENLLDIKGGIDDIKQYIDAVNQSELETALQELYEIIEHIRFIMNDSERVRTTLIQINGIRTVAKKNINLYKKQIEKIIERESESFKSDKETVITNNIKELRNNMVQYHYAVYLCNLAQILIINLNNIIDVEELSLYRNEISDIVNQYKGLFDKATKWTKHYIDETNSLNKVSKKQKVLTFGSGILGDVLGRKIGNYELAGQTKAQVNDWFDYKRNKKKEAHILSNKEFQRQMNDLVLIDSSISVMDRYIDMTLKKAEIVSIEGECYIKYIEEE
ncbi:hypothetical protein L1999_14245 [Neobacillus drentensis]|uniref:hypothetical protein n=1 Tax=Neobacillus drentensis TaxID=220684 RepID=UPI001F300F0B|nr:hypothetical protein [Neobacillus drentensis]ULT59609.1 hypothetical protein L1999_14245 [Neobacillus drentensis]